MFLQICLKMMVNYFDFFVLLSQNLKLILLFQICEQAPFGKGMETVVDTTVRNAWQIDAEKLILESELMERVQQQAENCVAEMMGSSDCQADIQVKPYKLVLYEEGGFFLPHKDTEKEKGHFATFIIHLPSAHTGGDLELEFMGKRKTVKSENSKKAILYTCFFTDVTHEIKPVIKGRRLALLFNLIKKDTSLLAPLDPTLIETQLSDALVSIIEFQLL